MGNSIFKFISSILIIILSQFIYVSKGISDTFYSNNLSSACNFVFSNYFKKFVKIENNNATFFINKNDPSVLFTTTNELDVSLQITVKKINNPKSPTITLFMALEKGKDFGNFIIPNLRQNFCNGKFKPINSSKNNLIANNSQSSASNLQDKIELNQKSKKVNIVENINITPLKTSSFNMGKFNYNKLEKINVSNSFPKYKLSAVESCETNRGKKWKTNLIFFADENLIWAARPYFSGLGVRLYMGTRKNDKIVFKVIEAHKNGTIS